MKKKFCPVENCKYETEVEKGFCPEHGEELVETKDAPEANDIKMKDLLEKIGDVAKKAAEEAIKEADIGGDKKDIHQKKTKISGGDRMNREQKLEFIKECIYKEAEENNPGALLDVSEYELKITDDEKRKFLANAQMAYMMKNMVRFNITKDPEYLGVVKALAEGVNADGGYLTPPEFRAELIRDLRDAPFLRGLVRTIPMSSDSLEIPKQATNVTVSWGSENTSITTTTVAFGTTTLTPYRLNSLLYTSRELVQDSAIAIIPLIRELFVEAIGLEEDRVIINGSNSGQPKGVLQETLGGIDNENSDANLPINIKKLPYKLTKRYRRNAKWVVNGQSLGAIAALKDTNHAFLMSTLKEGPTETLLAGLPIHECGDVPLDTLILGDWSKYWLGDRQQIAIETTTEGAGTFEKHQIAIKIVERIDGEVAITNAFKTLTNAGID